MNNEILNLEKMLFKLEYTSNKNWLNNIIHDDFKECGKSGKLFDKTITINDLSSLNEDRQIEIYNFECKQIDNNTCLVHYITISNNEKIYRTSIWIHDKNYKLLFHQASKLNEDITLLKC